MAILGIDEVGRGAWAGPLVVGAAVLARPIDGLADSKQLTKKRREELSAEILDSGASVGLGWVSSSDIDTIGLSAALRQATIAAASQVQAAYHEIIVDGTVNFLSDTTKGQYVTVLKKADQLISAVSAAAIVAKVARDKYMAELSEKYPDYGFDRHVGYGTAAHRKTLADFGVCPEHRLSFRPMSEYSERSSSTPKGSGLERAITTRHIGSLAENKVAEHLETIGHRILARNWKTRFCEIDIVSEYAGELYFTEVKYRRKATRGSGLEAITAKKQAQMAFAAESFAKMHNLGRTNLHLAAADVAGDNFEVQDFLVLL